MLQGLQNTLYSPELYIVYMHFVLGNVKYERKWKVRASENISEILLIALVAVYLPNTRPSSYCLLTSENLARTSRIVAFIPCFLAHIPVVVAVVVVIADAAVIFSIIPQAGSNTFL